MLTEEQARNQILDLGGELKRRAAKYRELERYFEGTCPIPDAVQQARVTKAYRMLMPMAEAPWGGLVVSSVQDRLEVAGIRSDDQETDDAVWGVWQDNHMDSESKLAHETAFIGGRAFALVWPKGDEAVQISLDTPEQMVVEYEEGSRFDRASALRSWVDRGDRRCATLYTRDALYKFQGPEHSTGLDGVRWEPRYVEGEEWPLPHTLGEVPAVEIAVNRRLKPGRFGYARGEYENCVGLLDRINLLTFLGLVVAFWMGFPLRGVIGEKILKTDDGETIPPFEATADSVFQFENPNAKLVEYSAADRKNLSIYGELDQLSTVTQTPRHYFPLEQGMSNISADAIRASEGALTSRVIGHKASLGEGWEEVERLAGKMLKDPVSLSERAQLVWKDHESRSMAERADAAVKVKDILPWTAIAERYLNFSQDDIARWESEGAGKVIQTLLEGANSDNGVTDAAA